MEITRGRFRRTDFTQARRGLRGELLALRHELELLDQALYAASASDAARNALGYAFTHLRAGERAWQESRQPDDLLVIVTRIDDARDALEASVAARRRGTRAGA